MKLKGGLAMMMALGLFAVACSDDDNQDDNKTQGDVTVTEVTNGDYTSYSDWTYINLETGQTETHPDATEWIYPYLTGDDQIREAQEAETVGIDWHIAIHRYEMKTNGGSVYDTQATDINAVNELPTGGTWVTDQAYPYGESAWEVITDMSKMMEGSVGYANNPTLNETLCGWVVRTETGSMPPTIYTPTNHVYVVKFADGSWAKLQFTDAGNIDTNASGYITWKYAFYPAE